MNTGKSRRRSPSLFGFYMVSSSIDPRDINRAKDNPEVIEYVEKPVSLSKFSELLKAFGID